MNELNHVKIVEWPGVFWICIWLLAIGMAIGGIRDNLSQLNTHVKELVQVQTQILNAGNILESGLTNQTESGSDESTSTH